MSTRVAQLSVQKFPAKIDGPALQDHMTFFFEAAGVTAFAIFGLVKSREMKSSGADELAAEGVLKPATELPAKRVLPGRVVVTEESLWPDEIAQAQSEVRPRSVRYWVCVAAAMSAILTAAPMQAQGSDVVDRIPGASMDSAVARSILFDAKGAAFRSSKDSHAQYILNRRIGPSVVEMHCEWDDIIVVRSGAGVLRHSRKFRQLKKYMRFEWRAGELVDAAEVMLLAGDVVRVPAGEGHSINSLGDAPLVYLIVKSMSADPKACASLPHRGQ